jgi:alanine dehydrogenase
MRIGIPKERKCHEYRVALVPETVADLVEQGLDVLVESGAGDGAGFCDDDYLSVGAKIVSQQALWQDGELIVKVKEPQPDEVSFVRPEHTLFCYLHLAACHTLMKELLARKCYAFAFETLTDDSGRLPLLMPMSQIAGKLAVLNGSYHLQKFAGGAGVLTAAVTGVEHTRITIVGGGVVGSAAARVALGIGAEVTIIDRNPVVLTQLEQQFGSSLNLVLSSPQALLRQLEQSHLVIGAVLIPGAAAPKVISLDMLKHMPKGSVLVDVAIDQGGCAESSRPTSHQDPTYEVGGVVHYCVTNIPGAVPQSASVVLSRILAPYVSALAQHGKDSIIKQSSGFANSLNLANGQVIHPALRST